MSEAAARPTSCRTPTRGTTPHGSRRRSPRSPTASASSSRSRPSCAPSCERSAPSELRRHAYDDEDWPAERGLPSAGLAPSPDWVAAVPPPLLARSGGAAARARGRVPAPRRGCSPASPTCCRDRIVLVMAVAWASSSLTEWAAAAKRARWRLEEIAPPAEPARSRRPRATGPWDMPVVEATVVERVPTPSRRRRGEAPRRTGRRSRRPRAGAEAPAGPPPPQARRDERADPAGDPWEA